MKLLTSFGNCPLTTAGLVDRVGDSRAADVGRGESRVLDVAGVLCERGSRSREGEHAADSKAANLHGKLVQI